MINNKISKKAKERLSIPENNPNYIDGRTLVVGKCLTCHTEIQLYHNVSHLCVKCVKKLQIRESKYAKILTKEFLIKEYNVAKKSVVRISEELNISSSTILKALHKYGFKVVYKRITKVYKKSFCKICHKQIANQRDTGLCGSCAQKEPKNEVECTCCHKKFGVINCKFKKNKYFFCSNVCRVKSQKIISKKGKEAPNYIHGEGYAPYPLEFNDALKDKIKNRDNHICQNCEMTEEEHLIVYGSVLHVHHIDYNKKNCKDNNLITLCQGCNTRANFNRDYWVKIYQQKIESVKVC